MDSTATITGIALGIALSAACGFRVFLPLLVLSAAAHSGAIPLASKWEWLSGTPALVVFSTATVVEIAAYYIPWLDNLLDAVTTPAAVMAGVIVTAAATPDMPAVFKWTLALIAGGGAAAVVQLTTTGARAVSSATTGGIANPVISTGEGAAALALSLFAIFIPLLALAIVLVLVYLCVRFVYRRLRGHRSPATEQPT